MAVTTHPLTGVFDADRTHSSFQFAVWHMKNSTFRASFGEFDARLTSDAAELRHMVRTAAAFDEGPIAFRYPRGNGVGVDMPERGRILVEVHAHPPTIRVSDSGPGIGED